MSAFQLSEKILNRFVAIKMFLKTRFRQKIVEEVCQIIKIVFTLDLLQFLAIC